MTRDDDALSEVVEAFTQHRGVRSKGALRLLADALGDADPAAGPGDDAAAIADGDGYLLAAGEAIWPPLVERDPRAAGVAAVVANVNDVCAMGGRPLALVDQIVAPEDTVRRVLDGLLHGCDVLGVPLVGGHLTARDGPAFVAASIVGRARTLLSASNVAAGQAIVVASALEGTLRDEFGYFSSLEERAGDARRDAELLPQLAEEGVCVAAKDVSMAGLLGSIAMLLEPTSSGCVVDLARIPRPGAVPLARWLGVFPSYSFVLCVPPASVSRCVSAFRDRGLAAERVGDVEASGAIELRLGAARRTLRDLRRNPVTYLGRVPRPTT